MKHRDTIIKLLIVLSGILQLAFSQIHIATITKVFYGGVGIYLFAFILLCAVCIFNINTLENNDKPRPLIVCNSLTILFGCIYSFLLFNDTKLDFAGISSSFFLTLASIVMLGVAIALCFVKKAQ